MMGSSLCFFRVKDRRPFLSDGQLVLVTLHRVEDVLAPTGKTWPNAFDVAPGVVGVVLGVATAKDVKQGFHILLVRPLLLAFGQRFDRQNCVGKRLQDEVAVTSGDRCWLPPAAAFANTHFSWPF